MLTSKYVYEFHYKQIEADIAYEMRKSCESRFNLERKKVMSYVHTTEGVGEIEKDVILEHYGYK